MSNDCYFKKLKKTVNSSPVSKIGELDVAFTTSNGFIQLVCQTGKTVEVELTDATFASVSTGNTLIDSTHAIIGSTTGSSSGFTVNIPTGTSGDYTFHAKIYSGKYNLNFLSHATLNFDELKYCRPMEYALYLGYDGGSLSSLAGIGNVRISSTGFKTSELSGFIGSDTTVINIGMLEGALSNIAALSGTVNTFSTTGDLLTGDLSVFQNKAFTSLTITNAVNITGDISVIGTMPNLTSINLTNATGLHGTIESIAQTARNASTPRTSGSINLPNIHLAGNGHITWQGVAITGGSKIEWTPTTITFNGQTITA